MKGCWIMPAKNKTPEMPPATAANADDSSEADGRQPQPRQNHRPLQRHGHLRRQRHRLPALEIWPTRQRFSLRQMAECASARYTSGPCVMDHFQQSQRGERSKLRRTRQNRLQRHRLAPSLSAGCGRRRPPRTRPRRSRRPLHPPSLRNRRTHPALRRRNGLRTFARGKEKILRGSQRPQRLRRQSRRPPRQTRSRHAARSTATPRRLWTRQHKPKPPT